MKEIREIIKRYESTDFEKESIALATVVKVEASSYRRIGARMLVSSSGQWIGGISGGCLEGDALRRSQQAIYSKVPSTVVYDTMDEDENEIGVGLGCNGRIEVLFIPINPDDEYNPIELLKQIVKLNKPIVLVSTFNSPHQDKLGSSFIAVKDKALHSFNEIKAEDLQQHIDTTSAKRRSHTFDVEDKDGAKHQLLFEFIRPEMKLVIIGDNYDVNALAGIVKELGWEIYIVGRKKKIHKNTYALAKKVYEYEDYEQVIIDEYTSVLMMTHDYNWDKIILEKVLAQKPSYVGMLGPKKRMQKMEKEEGLETLSEVSFFYSPIGLDIGAETPEEIAISIIAEILAVYRNRDGNQLRHREGTIHERYV